jgi:tetratricopeptide (TPR) repeat protein
MPRAAARPSAYFAPTLPEALAASIDRALESNPALRFESAREMEESFRAHSEVSLDDRMKRRVVPVAGGLLAALVVVLATGSLWLSRRAPATPITLGAQDSVLVTAFENRTREPLLDGTLEHALALEFSRSSFVTVVTRDRVQDALRLMQKPPDTAVTLAVGREISIRDGHIRALISGRIEKFGAIYALSVQILDPADGRVVAAVTEDANGESQVIPAVRRASLKMRRLLGEALESVTRSQTELARVTTPSLPALQRYSHAASIFHVSAAWVAVFPAGEAWLQNDVRRALIAVDTAASAIEAVPASARYQYASQVGLMYATLGRFTRAEEVLGFIPDQKERTFALGHVRGAQDDPTVIREFLVRYYPDIDEARGLVSLFVEAGLLGAARTLAAWHKRPSSQSGAEYVALLEGQLALAEGRVKEAIDLLDRSMQLNPHLGGPSSSRAARKLAVAWRTKGDLPRAIQTLERASVERRASITGWSAGSAWISLRADLAEAYRQAGRIPEAETVEAELLTLLDVADADHAVKTRLLRTRGATGSPRKP